MLSFFEAMVLCDLNILLCGNILNADQLADDPEAKGLCNLLYHIFRCSKNENAAQRGCLNGFAHGFSVSGQDKYSTAHRHNAVLLFFRRGTANHFSILDENAIINNGIGPIFLRHPQCTMTFPCPARANKSDYIHDILSP